MAGGAWRRWTREEDAQMHRSIIAYTGPEETIPWWLIASELGRSERDVEQRFSAHPDRYSFDRDPDMFPPPYYSDYSEEEDVAEEEDVEEKDDNIDDEDVEEEEDDNINDEGKNATKEEEIGDPNAKEGNVNPNAEEENKGSGDPNAKAENENSNAEDENENPNAGSN